MPSPDEPAGRPHDAFISYNREADLAIATALQRELERFAVPWYRMFPGARRTGTHD